MPVSPPPIEALTEFFGATTRHTRRVEIYEQDGVTRWVKDTEPRLKSGSVTVDYSRDERRAMDLVFSNDDGALENAPGEFWYDKVIKTFRGVQVNAPARQPRIVIMSDDTGAGAHAPALRNALLEVGFGDIMINPLASSYVVDIESFDIVVSLGETNKGALLKTAYDAGKSVFVVRKGAEYFLDALLGTWAGESRTVSASSMIAGRSSSDPRSVGWSSFAAVATTGAFKAPATNIASLYGIAYSPGSTASWAISSSTNAVGGKFIAVHYPMTAYQYSDGAFRQFLLSSMNWLNPIVPIIVWETQTGEFMIDRISEPHFPHEVKVTGRDYTKKCMLAKYNEATQYTSGSSLESIISAIATRAGIVKKLLPVTNIIIGRDFFFERNTSMWDAMKQVATAYNYEIYFDATGYLVIRPFRDPTTTTPVVYVSTGKDGNLAKYEKSTSDSQLFNHVLVTGESSDAAVIPVWAESKNTTPGSPTSIAEIGDRYWEYSSPFITTKAQAQALADSYLAVHQLEEFELSFDALMMPWLEVGDIMGFVDPNPAAGDPTTFLLSQITLPMSLAPMSGVGRRTTIAG